MKRGGINRVGRRARREASARRIWKKIVMAKNGGKCWRCGVTATDPHHMKRRPQCTKEDAGTRILRFLCADHVTIGFIITRLLRRRRGT